MDKTKDQREEGLRVQDEYRQRQIRLNKEHVARHNANIIPDHPGYVRFHGPRRQYRGSVDSKGRITWTEI